MIHDLSNQKEHNAEIKKSYPTQKDCELLINIMNRPCISDNGCSQEFKKLALKINGDLEGFEECFEKAFGVNSPWDCRTTFSSKGYSKKVLYWNQEKANKLGY